MAKHIDIPVKDRTKAFILSEDMADVHFSVGLEDEVKERIPAHKFVLATASEKFYGELYGRIGVAETIEVADTTPEAFKIMLRYIYTDEVDLDPGNAFPLLYLARKYLLSNLVGQVTEYVASAYSGLDVTKVLPHLHLMDGDYSESVWDAIELYADVVLSSPEFLELSHAALCDILRRDLDVDELTVYNGAMAWARAECARKQICFKTDARAVLGKALKLIRFPLMSVKEFSSGPEKSGLLTDQEKLEIYKWYTLRADHELTTFSSAPRQHPGTIPRL